MLPILHMSAKEHLDGLICVDTKDSAPTKRLVTQSLERMWFDYCVGQHPRASPLHTHTHLINVMSLTKESQHHSSVFPLIETSRRNILEDWILTLSKWMFSGPGEAGLIVPSSKKKKKRERKRKRNIRGQLMKSLADPVYPQRERKHRKWRVTHGVNSNTFVQVFRRLACRNPNRFQLNS